MKSIRRKILQWFSMVFATLCLSVSVISAVTIKPFSALAEETEGVEVTDNRPVAYIKGKFMYGTDLAIAHPSADGYVYLTIELDKAPVENVRVYYHTRDMSAIAAEGDYDAVKDSIVFTPDSYSKTIGIKVYSKSYNVYGLSKADKDYAYPYKNIDETRTFSVSLYKIESDNDSAVISGEKGSIKCSAGYNGFLTIDYTSGENAYYEVYSHGSLKSETWNSPEVDRGGYTYFQTYSDPGEWGEKSIKKTLDGDISFKKFLDAGLAQLQLTFDGTILDDNTWEYAGDTMVALRRREYLGKSYIDSLPIQALLNTDNLKGGTTTNIANQIKNLYYKSDLLTSIKDGNSGFSFMVKNFNQYGYISENDTLYFYVRDDDGGDDVWVNLFYSLSLKDLIAPEVISCHVEEDVYSGEKLGLSLRLSEPVQVLSDNLPYVDTGINYPSINSLRFNYVSGNGTDTLYFEADIPSTFNREIKSVRVMDIGNISSIRDYSSGYFDRNNQWVSKANCLVQPEYTTLKCQIDLRKPEISVNGNLSNAVTRSAEVTLNLENVGEGAKLYYSWTDDDSDPTKFDNVVTNLSDKYTVLGQNMNGKKWLHVKVVSEYGKEAVFSRGYYRFDNSPPEMTIELDNEVSSLTQKKFDLEISDGEEGLCAGLKGVYILISESPDGAEAKQRVVYIGKEEAEKRLTYTLTAADLELGENEYKTYYIAFYAEDMISNRTASENIVYTPYRFDTRDFFDCSFSKAVSAEGNDLLIDTTSDVKRVVDITKTPTIYIEYSDVDDPQAENFKMSDGTDCVFETSYEEIEGKKYAKITVTQCKSGYAEFYLFANDGGTEKVSDVFSFYFTFGGSDKTTHYNKVQNGTIIINDVYQLSEESAFTYKGADGVVMRANYGNTTLPASFSSAFEAKKYVYYTELLDLYAVTINDYQAGLLNGGTTDDYVKAKNESVKAVAGQVWIRYKNSTWQNSTSNNAWVWYYYGPSAQDGINVNGLSDNLMSALNTVSERIVGYGKQMYLAGEGNVNSFGEPYLAPAQIHVGEESATQSLSGTMFSPSVKYDGDGGMYSSYAKELEKEYVIATNLPLTFGENTKLYYKKADASSFAEIGRENLYLSDVIKVSGVYEIKEYDDNGMSVFEVYVDVAAPILTALIKRPDGSQSDMEFDEQSNGIVYNAKEIYFNRISELEKDEYAYVAVYKYVTSSTGSLLNVYNRKQIESGSLVLEDGNYHIEVSDRSGNSYSFVLRLSATVMACTVIEEPNRYLRIDCNRGEEQIASYEIYCNGKLITSNYATTARYTQSGYYEIYIKDIYGNEFTQTYMFERAIPAVSWKYYTNDGFVAYEEGATNHVRIVQMSERIYAVTTNVLLQFSYSDGYSISSDITWKENPITHARTMETLTEFTLTVWYTDFQENYVTYVCSIDNTAPNIAARREVMTYSPAETDELSSQVEKGEEGDVLSQTTIGYGKGNASERFITDGETVSSRFIRLSVTDAGGVAKVTIYFDGKLYLEETENFTNIVLSRYGEYKIQAVDLFGNTSEFAFTNTKTTFVDYYVDGEQMDADYSCLEYFVSGVYTKKEYGNEFVLIKLNRDAEVVYKITGENTYFARFSLKNGELFSVTYVITLNSLGEKRIEEKKSEILLSITDENFKVDEWYQIASVEKAGAEIYASFDKDGNVLIKVLAPQTSVLTAECRVRAATDIEPFYFLAELSAEKTNVTLIDADDEVIETNTEGTQIKINKGFTVSDDFIEGGKVVSVKVYHSAIGEFTEYATVYDGEYHLFEFSDEGMYLVEIENVYGDITKYYLILSDRFVATTKAEFSDGDEAVYSSAYEDVVYSNSKVVVTAYAENIDVLVKKDGEIYSQAVITEVDGKTIVSIEGDGKYEITLTDEFGNVIIRKAEIATDNPIYEEGLIYGFNEAALKLSEGYTNKKLSISKELLIEKGFSYIAVRYGNDVTVLYDMISESKTELDENALKECIGNSGDGEYFVIFRDKFGNILSVTIKYRKTPTLELSRTVRSSLVQEKCNIEDALKYGLWSNNTLNFSCVATEYIFTVNGNRTECPYALSFGSGAEEGSFEYAITYVDEYGFSYEFTATLMRRKIEISLPSSVEGKLIEGVPTTRYSFPVVINADTTCLYTLNGGEETVYEKGGVMYADGLYRFTATDIAGNIATFTVRKDSAVLFTFTETAVATELVNGGIACTDKVTFAAAGGDDAFIEKVFLDGKYLSDYEDRNFTESGKWEVIISDGAGNQAYFSFYIMTHSVKEFVYTAPYMYRISEVWYDSGDGTRISYMQFVTGDGKDCDFTENGTYSIVMFSELAGNTVNFSVKVNNIAPEVSLVGCNEGETTINDITITGYKVGDTIEVYKDGKLVRSVTILTSSTDAPVIKDGGEYTIVVRNQAGVETSLSFVRKHIPNVAGNILIFVSIFACVALISVGMFYRNHSKSDD